jgi:hypothetical protein
VTASLQEFERDLQRDLRGLSQQAHVAVAVVICDLMLPGVGGPRGATILPVLKDAVELAWSSSQGGSLDRSEIRRVLAGVEALVSTDDEPYSLQLAVNDFAIFAVAYALDATIADSVQNVVWCARQLVELADSVEAEGVPPPAAEEELYILVTAAIRRIVRRMGQASLSSVRDYLALERDQITRLVFDRIPRADH